MFDNETDFMCEYEDDYGMEYSDEPNVEFVNLYYNSKALKEDDLHAALNSFQQLLDLENGEKGEWGFKALKQTIKINFKLNNYEEMILRYKQLLTYISVVACTHFEKSLNSILDYASTSNNMQLLESLYETTLDARKDAKINRIWLKTNTRLGKLYLDRGEFAKLQNILEQLHGYCQTDDSQDDPKKGTEMLEIYALEIQMYSAQKNNMKLKEVYEHSLLIQSAIPHPQIIGVIRECGGKMHLHQGEFELAYTDFFEAFKNYDESGSPRCIPCLNYLILANMLRKSSINPLDSQEAKRYKFDPRIRPMANLMQFYQAISIHEFESTLELNKTEIMADPRIREHIPELRFNIRTQAIIQVAGLVRRISIPHIGSMLNIEAIEVENLLAFSILNNTINGSIRRANEWEFERHI